MRIRGFEVRVIPGDHEPPHVHVYRSGAQIKIGLAPLEILEVQGRPSRSEIREARRIVAEHLDACLQAFEEYGA